MRPAGVLLLSGFATMALQMCAVRLLAPVVGAATPVWATTIALSLLAMTTGYLLGGRLAVRRPSGLVLGATLGSAGLLVLTVSFVRGPDWVSLGLTDVTWASVVGAAVGFAALFLLPAVLLGVTPPFVMHLVVAGPERGGAMVGRLYAVSTVGSILGTLLPSLLLLQWVGTAATLRVVAVLLALAALVALRVGVSTRRPAAGTRPTRRRWSSASRGDVHRDPISGVLLLVVLAEGIASMTTEIAAARLVAPFFGASHAVWAVLITVCLGAIALGSYVGGRLADRNPTRDALARLLVLAALLVVALPFAIRPVLLASRGTIEDVDVPRLVATFLGSVVLCGVPMCLLGMVPPWALRIALDGDGLAAGVGRLAGRLYALSTGGALAGTFATALWLVPLLGSRGTLALAALLVVGVGLVLARPGRLVTGAVTAATLALVVAAVVVPQGLVKPGADRVLAERESTYQFVQVVEEPSGRRLLQMNEGWATHSVYDPGRWLTGGYWDDFLALPDLLQPGTPGDSLLVLGNAGGTVPRLFRHFRPEVRVDGVEIDPIVTELGERWLDLAGPNLTVTTADARPFLAHAGKGAAARSWSMVVIDAYRQPYIPFYLTTREFFTAVRDHLAPGGVVAINVSRTPGDTRLEDALARTLGTVFGYVGRHRSGDYNEMLVAARQEPPTSTDDTGSLGGLVVLDDLEQVRQDRGAPVLTDDKAPVEWMTDLMIFGQA